MAGIILDTGPLVALMDRREKFHDWTVSQLPRLNGPFITCDAVLIEAFFLLSSSPRPQEQLRSYLRKRVIISKFDLTESLSRVLELMDTYGNVPMSFADACLVSMVENHPESCVFTLDRDFTIYRQQRRRVIPLIAPF